MYLVRLCRHSQKYDMWYVSPFISSCSTQPVSQGCECNLESIDFCDSTDALITTSPSTLTTYDRLSSGKLTLKSTRCSYKLIILRHQTLSYINSKILNSFVGARAFCSIGPKWKPVIGNFSIILLLLLIDFHFSWYWSHSWEFPPTG